MNVITLGVLKGDQKVSFVVAISAPSMQTDTKYFVATSPCDVFSSLGQSRRQQQDSHDSHSESSS